MNIEKRIVQLDGLRAIMCAIIFVSHLNIFPLPKVIDHFYNTYIENPTIAVDFFFVLSGFGVYYSYSNSSTELKTGFHFAKKRISKMYPIYVVSLVLGVLYCVTTQAATGSLDLFEVIKIIIKLFIALTLTQSLIGDQGIAGTFNAPAWFISSLFFSYMLCPLFIKITKRTKNKKELVLNIIATYLLILLLSAIALKIEGISLFNGLYDINYLFYAHPAIRCLYLLMGMQIARAYTKSFIKANGMFSTIYITASILYYFLRDKLCFSQIQYRAIDVINCCVLLIVVLSNNKIKTLLSNKNLVDLGNNSAYIYFYHWPIIFLIIEAFSLLNINKWPYTIIEISLEIIILIFTIKTTKTLLRQK